MKTEVADNTTSCKETCPLNVAEYAFFYTKNRKILILGSSNTSFAETKHQDYLLLPAKRPYRFINIFIVVSVTIKRTDFIKELEVHTDLNFFPNPLVDIYHKKTIDFLGLIPFLFLWTCYLFCTVLSLHSDFSINPLFRNFIYYFKKVEK